MQSAAVPGQLTWQLPLEWALMLWYPAHSEGGALLRGMPDKTPPKQTVSWELWVWHEQVLALSGPQFPHL